MKKSMKFLERENSHLIWVINVLSEDGVKKEKECKKIQSELNISNARIVDLQKNIDVKSASSTPHQFSEALKKSKEFLSTLKTHGVSSDDATSALRSGDSVQFLSFDDIENDVNNFSSRFMPNVKFRANLHRELLAKILIDANQSTMLGYDFYKTNDNGIATACPAQTTYDYWEEKEVSIYEAIPELVPEGYEFKNGSLVSLASGISKDSAITDCFDYNKKDVDYEGLLKYGDPTKCNPISSLAKKVAISYPFNCSEVQWVIDTFGEDRVSNILDMLCTCGLKLSDIEPLKK